MSPQQKLSDGGAVITAGLFGLSLGDWALIVQIIAGIAAFAVAAVTIYYRIRQGRK